MSRIAVAGAGLTGCLLAIRLAERGHDVHLYDRRPDLRVADVDAGRSINLALSTRGIDALSRVARPGGGTLADTVLERAIVMPGRIIHATGRTDTVFQPYGTQADHVLHSVERDALNVALLDAVDATAGVTTHFSHRVRDVGVSRPVITVESDGEIRTEPADVVFGADGAYSAIRGRLQRTGRIDFSQTFLPHGYKELTIPAGPDGTHALDPHGLHIWPRGGHMMIALPNHDGSFTATLFWPFDHDGDTAPGGASFAALDRAAAEGDDTVLALLGAHYPDVVPLMPDIAHEARTNPASSLVTITCGPWHHEGRLLVIGDAAHAVVPFYGQGANAGLEDVTVLMEAYDRHGDDAHHAAFTHLSTSRKADTDALARLAVEHYDEMRDSVASRWFRATAALGRLLARIAPGRFVPLYTMVSFTRTPYAEAVRRAAHQDTILHRVAVALVAVALAAVVLAVLILAT